MERAAKFMRELDKSMNAKAAIELARREQDVDLAREATKSKEAEAQRAAHMANAEKVRWEEQRKTLEAKRDNEKVRETPLCSDNISPRPPCNNVRRARSAVVTCSHVSNVAATGFVMSLPFAGHC